MVNKKTFCKKIFRKGVVLLVSLVGALAFLSLTGCRENMTGMLNPKGIITYEERQLFFDALALMLVVVIPVIIMSFVFVVRYRASHKTSEYKPNWGHSFLLEVIWWGVPCVIIIILGALTWIKTHELDPYRKINVPGKPLLIQAVALPWKWLFIYPEQHIATVNFLEIPENKQIEFELTTDNVPMSAFFIPQLSSQIYTMAGMRTRLHLVAVTTGVFQGLNAQYNGDGFSDMHFQVKVVDDVEMKAWVSSVKTTKPALTSATYSKLMQPAIAYPVELYSGSPNGLFEQIIRKHKSVTGVPLDWNYHPEIP